MTFISKQLEAMSSKQIHKRLETLLNAWRCGDVERVVSCFSEQGVYFASVGPEPGERAQGHQHIRRLVRRMLAHDANTEASIEYLTADQTTAYWRWRYQHADGSAEIGCDFFHFRGDLIALKDSFRKQSLIGADQQITEGRL